MSIRTKYFIPLLVLVLLLSGTPVSVSAPVVSDISGHWAEAAILRWIDNGVLGGYPDGTFRPDNTVTRGELATVINRLMHFPVAPDDMEIFTDLDGKWYASDINALALQGAYLVTHGEAKGDAALTREEAMVMVFNAFPVTSPGYQNRFSDSSIINPDYSDRINTMLNTGFLSGFPDRSFHPKDPITRAQVMTILNNMIDEYITEPGVYEGLDGRRVLVAVPDVEIKNSGWLSYLAVSPRAGIGGGVVTGRTKLASIWSYDHKPESVSIKSDYAIVSRFLQVYNDRFTDGTGLKDFPYLISNQAQLALLNEYLNTQYKDMHFALANDITLSGQWTPIGCYYEDKLKPSVSFHSTFDGKGFAVNGLSILSDTHEGDAAGLFASLAERAYICNLTVSGEIKLDTKKDLLYVGGIFGHASGSHIHNCVSHVDITVNATSAVSVGGVIGLIRGAVLSDCRADGKITASAKNPDANDYAYAGGIVGTGVKHVTIKNCISYADVSADASNDAFAGGIVGYYIDGGSIIDCQAHGVVRAATTGTSFSGACAGGVAGNIDFNGKVQGCVSHASVFSTASFKAYAGGITGYITGDPYFREGVLDSCEAYGEVNAVSLGRVTGSSSHAGGIAGLTSRVLVTGCYSGATVTASGGNESYAGGITGTLTNTVVGTIKTIIEDCFSLGKVHAKDSRMQNNSGGVVGQMYGTRAVRCATGAEVSASGTPGYFNAVGGFAGSMYINETVAYNVSAIDCYSVGPVSCPEGYSSIAGFTGRMEGSLENCYTASQISASKPLNDFAYQGLVGTIRSDIQTVNCGVFTGTVLHFYDNVANPSGKITPVQKAEIMTAQVYTKQGWDFESVWVMPDDSDNYKLPILQGAFEDMQRALKMPTHLS